MRRDETGLEFFCLFSLSRVLRTSCAKRKHKSVAKDPSLLFSCYRYEMFCFREFNDIFSYLYIHPYLIRVTNLTYTPICYSAHSCVYIYLS